MKMMQQHSDMQLSLELSVLCCESQESSPETTAPMHTASAPGPNTTDILNHNVLQALKSNVMSTNGSSAELRL